MNSQQMLELIYSEKQTKGDLSVDFLILRDLFHDEGDPEMAATLDWMVENSKRPWRVERRTGVVWYRWDCITLEKHKRLPSYLQRNMFDHIGRNRSRSPMTALVKLKNALVKAGVITKRRRRRR